MCKSEKHKNIIERVRDRYVDYQFTVEHLANEVGLSLSQLRERIHFEYGMSPQELIETVRLEEAIKSLCKNKRQNLYELCATVGYMSLRTFLDAFKRRVGVTPTHWRAAVEELHDTSEEMDRCIGLLWSNKGPDEKFR